MTKLGIETTKEKLKTMVQEVDQDNDKTISFDEFVSVAQKARAGAGVAFTDVVTKQQVRPRPTRQTRMPTGCATGASGGVRARALARRCRCRHRGRRRRT